MQSGNHSRRSFLPSLSLSLLIFFPPHFSSGSVLVANTKRVYNISYLLYSEKRGFSSGGLWRDRCRSGCSFRAHFGSFLFRFFGRLVIDYRLSSRLWWLLLLLLTRWHTDSPLFSFPLSFSLWSVIRFFVIRVNGHSQEGRQASEWSTAIESLERRPGGKNKQQQQQREIEVNLHRSEAGRICLPEQASFPFFPFLLFISSCKFNYGVVIQGKRRAARASETATSTSTTSTTVAASSSSFFSQKWNHSRWQ